jgi:uncharacterized protein (DUF924 family)
MILSKIPIDKIMKFWFPNQTYNKFWFDKNEDIDNLINKEYSYLVMEVFNEFNNLNLNNLL